MTTVYLLHFDPPYKHAQHYIGVTNRNDVTERLREHQSGQGAVLCRAAVAAGCEIKMVRTWAGVKRRYELQLKGRSAKPLCPICAPGLQPRVRRRR